MAIQSISSSQMTYQGSVSGTETIKEAPERSTGSVKAAEPVSAEKNTGTTVISEDSLTKKENGNNNSNNSSNTKIAGTGAGTEALKKAAEEIKRNSKNSEAIFGVHEGTNRITIKIVDKETKELIKEYPPEKTLDMIAKVWEMAGLMVDEKR